MFEQTQLVVCVSVGTENIVGKCILISIIEREEKKLFFREKFNSFSK